MTPDGTVELVSRDQILRRERGQENIYFRCPTDHEQDYWQPYPVDPSLAMYDDYTYIQGDFIYVMSNNSNRTVLFALDVWSLMELIVCLASGR